MTTELSGRTGRGAASRRADGESPALGRRGGGDARGDTERRRRDGRTGGEGGLVRASDDGERGLVRASDDGERGLVRASDDGERKRRRAEADADPETVARQICLRLLSAAPRTQAQLAAALRRRGVPEDAATAVLERFNEVKLIDDELFARAWVESRHHGRGLASRALGAELRQRGVAADDIQVALSQLDPQQELATALELIERRLEATEGMPTVARMRRLTGVLARKGYSAGLAYRVVREALEREAVGRASVTHDLDDLPEPADDEAPAEPWGT